MNDPSTERIVADGRERAARGNGLEARQRAAAQAIRRRYRDRLARARGLRRLAIWLRMQREIHRAEQRLEAELAPRDGLYLADLRERS